MHLTPREVDKLLIFSAAELARQRRARGLKLNHPEAVALITSEILELIRDGKSVAEITSIGSTILPVDAVMGHVTEAAEAGRSGAFDPLLSQAETDRLRRDLRLAFYVHYRAASLGVHSPNLASAELEI